MSARTGPIVRNYLDFPRADCVLTGHQRDIRALQRVLKKEGFARHLSVKIENDAIHFAHSSIELTALAQKYPVLLNPFLAEKRGLSYIFARDREPAPETSSLKLCESPNSKDNLVQSLIETANQHYQTIQVPCPVKFAFDPKAADGENLKAVYRRFQGLFIGESHPHVNPKKFLIENMEKLRDLGVETLFMEDFFYDTQQSLLDHYMNDPDPDAEIPFLLAVVLEFYNKRYLMPEPYRIIDIVRKAKRCGIRIVGIDTSASYQISLNNESFKKDNHLGITQRRVQAMNYVAQKIIQHEKGKGNYVALMGGDHAATLVLHNNDNRSRVKFISPGLADLFGCPLIIIHDTADANEKPPVTLTDITYSGSYFKRHVHLYLRRPKEYIHSSSSSPVKKTPLVNQAITKVANCFRRLCPRNCGNKSGRNDR